MSNELVAVFERQLAQNDLPGAANTLQKLRQTGSQDLQFSAQLQIYSARLAYASGNADVAETIYRQLLKTETRQKLLTQARQGLLTIENDERREQDARIAQALAIAGGNEPGFLALLPVAPERKEWVAAKLARILHLDIYTARAQIPARHLRILRIGTYGELGVYGQQLQAVDVDTLWISLTAIAELPVYTVDYFELPDVHSVRAVCGDRVVLFDLADVACRVDGVLPTFGDVVTVDAKHQIVMKEQELDRVRICDLHLSEVGEEVPGCILRFHEYHYQFDRGMQLEIPRSVKHLAPTVQERWAVLMQWLVGALPDLAVRTDFLPFAEMSMHYPDFLNLLDPKIDLGRKKENVWDRCFQLFSGTIFLSR